MAAPEKGVNGHDSAPAMQQAHQRCRYPYLHAFAAGGISHDGGKTMSGYKIDFGLRLGVAAGRSIRLDLPRGCTGAHLAELLQAAAAAVHAWVLDCEAQGTDPRDALPDGVPHGVAHATAHGTACPTCSSSAPERHATCKRPDCAMAAAREKGQPITAPGALHGALCAAFPAPWCTVCSMAGLQAPACADCAELARQHAARYPQPSTDLPTGAAHDEEESKTRH